MSAQPSSPAPSPTPRPPTLSAPSGDHDSNTSVSRLSPHPLPPLSPSSHSALAPLLSQLSSLQQDLLSELEEEFSASKLDVNSVKDICHYFLNEYLTCGIKWQQKQREKGSERLSAIPDSALVEVPLIQPQWRVRMWKILLGCHNKDETLVSQYLHDHPEAVTVHSTTVDDDLGGEIDDLPGMRRRRSEKEGHQAETIAQEKLIHRDVTRTRPHDPRLLPQYRSSLSMLLTFYCRSRGVAYKQGLNEILTPLLIMAEESAAASASSSASSSPSPSPSSPLDVAYNLFYSLITRFLPSMFNDNDFENLRCIFRSFRLLLLYFDPLLASHVDSHNILPELYATPWFITLFARDCHVDVLFFLWDVYLIEDDPFLHYFLALALLMQQRDMLLNMDAAALPVSLRKLRLHSLLPLLAQARALREQTPPSMRQHLYDITFTVMQPEVMEMISTYDSLLPSLSIPASEVVQASHPDLSDASASPGLRVVPLDVREKRQWENGHLGSALHINPCCLFQPGGVERLMQRFEPMKGQHLCIVGNEMRTYNTLVAMASAGGAERATVSATPVLDGFLAAIRDTSVDAEEAHRMYLTPLELMEMEKEDIKREAHRKWQQGKGAAPPVAAVVVGGKPLRSPSPAQTAQPAKTPPPTLPPSPLGSPAVSPPTSTVASPETSLPPPGSTAGGAVAESSGGAGGGAVVYSFPATSPVMDPYTASLVHLFLRHGFTHVSVCEGGYPACHELVMSISRDKDSKKDRDKTRKQAAAAAAAAAIAATATTAATATPTAVPVASVAPIELVDHMAMNCLCCSPRLYEKWREEKVKRKREAERRAEKERLAAEKEKERLEREEQQRKQKEEAEMKAQEERQKKRDAGELVDEPTETASAAAPPAPAAAVASEKLHSFSKWLSSKAVAATAAAKASSRAHSPAPTVTVAAAAPADGSKAADTTERKEASQDGAADKKQTAASPAPASSTSSYFSKFESQARALAKKLSDSASTAHPPPAPAPMTEKERLTLQHQAEKRAEREMSVSVDLREWMKDDALSLFSAHEVRKIAGSTQGLLIPRVLAVSEGYIVSLRPDNSRTAGKDRQRRKLSDTARPGGAAGGSAEGGGGGGGWFDRVVGAVTAAAASTTAASGSAAATDSSAPKLPAPAAAPGAGSPAAPPTASAFSLAPVEDPELMENNEDTPQQPEHDGSGHTITQLSSPSSSASSSVPSSPSSHAASMSGVSLTTPTNEAFTILGSGFAFIHSKRRITELDRITSKRDRPCLLTFHWKPDATAAEGTAATQTLYVIDRPKECIDIVKRRFSRAKRIEREKERSADNTDDDDDDATDGGVKAATTNPTTDSTVKQDVTQQQSAAPARAAETTAQPPAQDAAVPDM